MELKSLAAKPQLIKIVIDDADIVEKYGDTVEVYTWDRQNMDTFVKLASLDYSNMQSVTDVVKNLILDSEGKPVINDENALPTDILMKSINAVVEELGKSVSSTTTSKTGNSK
jgi:hypothetical protein